MNFSFPQFVTPIPLEDHRFWTARFGSYDQRHDDAYYEVTILTTDQLEVTRFTARVSLSWAGDDWTGAEFGTRLHAALLEVASTGKTNVG
jgi:hypothetical protein